MIGGSSLLTETNLFVINHIIFVFLTQTLSKQKHSVQNFDDIWQFHQAKNYFGKLEIIQRQESFWIWLKMEGRLLVTVTACHPNLLQDVNFDLYFVYLDRSTVDVPSIDMIHGPF